MQSNDSGPNLVNRKKPNATAKPSSQPSESKPAKSPQKSSPNTQSFYQTLFGQHTFLLLLAVRSVSAYYNQIWDCDETYNYWEPLHFVLFGNGHQTWEYSPAFALRSYLYIYLHALPVWPLVQFVSSKITLFYTLRFVFALVSSYMESYLYKSLAARFINTYPNIARYYLLFTLTNIGKLLLETIEKRTEI
jgi:hypothetical protein